MRYLLAALVAGGLLLQASGCAQQTLSLKPAPRAFTPRDYDEIYRRWTRSADSFNVGRLSDVLNVTATFESWEFRWAYVVRYSSDHGLNIEERTEALRATLADAQVHHRFFITLSGTDFRESDLTRDQTAWRVLLVDPSGRQTVPVEVERVRKPGAVERRYFPSVSPFRHAFRLAFAAKRADGSRTIPERGGFILLRFTGPEGTVDLRWKLARISQSQDR